MEVILDEEEVAIDDVPLATKSLKIVDWKIHKEGKKSYYQIVRADGKSQMYKVFSQMLKSFTREDLEDLYKLVKAKYGSTRPVEDLDLSIDEGPFKMGRCRDDIASGTDGPYLGLERDRLVADLAQAEKDRLRADIRAMNILLQGLPRDIYKLINHNTDANDIWDNVKMLLEGSELTKDDRESQCTDKFEISGNTKGEKFMD
ncbi:hypothetical protein Tco_0448345 [Tanacetum coccineum]